LVSGGLVNLYNYKYNNHDYTYFCFIMNFINRVSELEKLRELWNEDSAQLVVFYGKRRVGKTELIKEFIKDGKGVYYLADKRGHGDQLLEFARVVGDFFHDDFLYEQGFSDWLQAFRYLNEKAQSQRFVVAIDEYPYLVETDSATSSVFQKAWDEFLKDSKIFLIICGSSISMMESELLSMKAPLYGRLTGRMLIESMDYQAARQFFPAKSFNEFLSFYAVTGGMPAYMQQFSKYENVKEALKKLCWDKLGLYHDEVSLSLKQELRKPNNYFSILKAIAFGKSRISEIANYSGLSVQFVNKYIDTLKSLQFVKREVPVLEDKAHKSKKGIYVLSENFVRFWFLYVYSYSSDLEIGNYKNVEKRFDEYFNVLESYVYEQLARDDLLRSQDRLFQMDKLGRYWDKDVEIDGLGFNLKTKQIVFMEAKWTNARFDLRALKKLQKKVMGVVWHNDVRQEYFVIYSKSGFAKDLLDYAAVNERIVLVLGVGNVG